MARWMDFGTVGKSQALTEHLFRILGLLTSAHPTFN
jgi:hypothetical protein